MAIDKKLIIERRLQRLSGMSPQKRLEIAAQAATQPVWGRCWKCSEITTAPYNELKTCTHCGANLWSRE